MVAIEAKYHFTCLNQYRNRYRTFKRQHKADFDKTVERDKARAFVEVVSYLENAIEEGTHIFKMKDLHTYSLPE